MAASSFLGLAQTTSTQTYPASFAGSFASQQLASVQQNIVANNVRAQTIFYKEEFKVAPFNPVPPDTSGLYGIAQLNAGGNPSATVAIPTITTTSAVLITFMYPAAGVSVNQTLTPTVVGNVRMYNPNPMALVLGDNPNPPPVQIPNTTSDNNDIIGGIDGAAGAVNTVTYVQPAYTIVITPQVGFTLTANCSTFADLEFQYFVNVQ
jgi:hypothetical protein